MRVHNFVKLQSKADTPVYIGSWGATSKLYV